MAMFAVKMLKNKFYILSVGENVELTDGEWILIETERGEEATKAILVSPELEKQWKKGKVEKYKFIRKLTDADKETLAKLKCDECNALRQCKELVTKHSLNMNLVQCKYTFDKKKISFYYTAPERVDFRGLLKDLTQIFRRVRIDLRHIGVRDETSMLDGCGLCGRQFCCSSFLRSFDSINIKLARDQGMPITPGKISGSCGRLLCCLNYEYKNYINAAKDLPPVGSGVMTVDGVGRVCALRFLSNKLAVKLEDGKIKEFSKDEIEMLDQEVNIVLDDSFKYTEETDLHIDINQLEDDANSSTGSI